MKNPFGRVYFYSLLIMGVSFILFYLFRNRLTNSFVTLFVNDLHLLPSDWIYNELVVGLLGLEACFNAWVFSKAYGWRHGMEQANIPLEQVNVRLEAMSHQLDQTNSAIEMLNTNLEIIVDAFYKGKIAPPEFPVIQEEEGKEPIKVPA